MGGTSSSEGQHWGTQEPQSVVAPVPPIAPIKEPWVRLGIVAVVLILAVACVPLVMGFAKRAVTGFDVDPLTEDGYAQMLDALEEKTGDTLVFRATLSEDLATLDVSADSTSGREITYWWSGEWHPPTSDAPASADFDPRSAAAAAVGGMASLDSFLSGYAMPQGA